MDKQLRAFLAIARSGTTTAAAKELNVAQSAVTKRISNLEHELGTALFFREYRGMSLTEAGKLLMVRATRIEREYRDGKDEISAIASAGLSNLRIGAGPVFYLNWAAPLIGMLKQTYPGLTIDLRTMDNEEPASQLMSGDIDVYLGMIPEDKIDESISTSVVLQIEHGIVMRADDPNSQRENVDPGRLKHYDWVSFVADPVTERSIETYTLPKGSKSSLITIRTTSFTTGIQLVKSGSFIMSAPLQLERFVKKDGLVIRPVEKGMPRRDAGVYARKSSLGFGAVKTVRRFFDEVRV
ncbi:HTH-type transcriptional regulator CynR [Marinovum algicola]|uniref:DNA-binding transcriptional regulator, LysR family n=1 Tax=Marinovum algicola TaxID=42444 RepID=A0A975ZR39_9RHOB|nr:LysR family transcriptional regulator [Marinovum algicola]SEK11094.1 DNA-binding transcriptional regulator, LysR family [Marinovum algicola]SLN71096.1 HTH-type transcriptional regulator CynR [Marinovum algicola]